MTGLLLGVATACGGSPGRNGEPAGAPGGAAADPLLAADTARTTRYFVRLVAGADPGAVAARHGVEPLRVITEPVPAFYAALTPAQHDALEEDGEVVSLAREIHQGELPMPPPRPLPPPDTAR